MKFMRPDWDYWRDNRATNLVSAILLSLGAEPRQFNDEKNRYFDFPGYEQRRKLAHIAALNGRFGKKQDTPSTM